MEDSRIFAIASNNLCGQSTGKFGASGGPRAVAIAKQEKSILFNYV